MADPDLKREVHAILNNMQDSSIHIINSGFGFS